MLYRRDIRNDCRRLWTGRWTEMAPDTEIRPELVTFAIVSPQKHGSWNPHRHIGYELIIPVQGTVYECHLNSRKIKLHSGEALFLEPDDLHIDLLAPGCIFYAFNFQLRRLPGHFPAPGIFQKGIPAENRKLRFPPDEVYSLITGIQTHIERAPKTVYYSVDALFAALFWELAAAVPENLLEPLLLRRCNDDKMLSELIAVFENNLTRNLTNREIASRLHISVSLLTHRCAKLLGISPAKAFLKYRVRMAEQMFHDHPSIRVKEVAEKLGFPNEFHFSRAFKRVTGRAPSASAR